jgi:7-carboxy-7-deazaguanine synthase
VSPLRVSELFTSLQGEGASAGAPATFLRLGDCNLNCAYCDTRSSWDWEHYRRKEELSEHDVLEMARRIRASGPRRLVITGGEPLLQQPTIDALLRELDGFCIEIETNGTVPPVAGLSCRVDQWNVSPKLSNSGIRESMRLKLDALASFCATQRAWLKFVVSASAQLSEVAHIVAVTGWPAERVILMPQASDVAQLEEQSRWVAEAALERGYRFSTRLHLMLWGNSRGH